jgi:hypothetical protein
MKNDEPIMASETQSRVNRKKGKEGRYLIALPTGDNGKRFAITHWLVMGLGGSETAAP